MTRRETICAWVSILLIVLFFAMVAGELAAGA